MYVSRRKWSSCSKSSNVDWRRCRTSSESEENSSDKQRSLPASCLQRSRDVCNLSIVIFISNCWVSRRECRFTISCCKECIELWFSSNCKDSRSIRDISSLFSFKSWNDPNQFMQQEKNQFLFITSNQKHTTKEGISTIRIGKLKIDDKLHDSENLQDRKTGTKWQTSETTFSLSTNDARYSWSLLFAKSCSSRRIFKDEEREEVVVRSFSRSSFNKIFCA